MLNQSDDILIRSMSKFHLLFAWQHDVHMFCLFVKTVEIVSFVISNSIFLFSLLLFSSDVVSLYCSILQFNHVLVLFSRLHHHDWSPLSLPKNHSNNFLFGWFHQKYQILRIRNYSIYHNLSINTITIPTIRRLLYYKQNRKREVLCNKAVDLLLYQII